MNATAHTGSIVDESTLISFKEFCKLCGVDEEYITELVELGILEPEDENVSIWKFSILQLQRFQKAQRLRYGLKLNLSGVALGLDLLEQIEILERKLKMLENQIKLFHGKF